MNGFVFKRNREIDALLRLVYTGHSLRYGYSGFRLRKDGSCGHGTWSTYIDELEYHNYTKITSATEFIENWDLIMEYLKLSNMNRRS